MISYKAEEIGALIKRCLEKHSYSKKELAETLGISEAAISKWENGSIKLSNLVSICYILGIDIDDIFTRKKSEYGYINEDYNLTIYLTNSRVDEAKLKTSLDKQDLVKKYINCLNRFNKDLEIVCNNNIDELGFPFNSLLDKSITEALSIRYKNDKLDFMDLVRHSGFVDYSDILSNLTIELNLDSKVFLYTRDNNSLLLDYLKAIGRTRALNIIKANYNSLSRTDKVELFDYLLDINLT